MKKTSCFRLSEEALQLLKEISSHKGVGRASVIELLLREEVRRIKSEKVKA